MTRLSGVPARIRNRASLPRGGAARVWLFVAVMAASALLVYGWAIVDLGTAPSPVELPWWLLAIMFFVAEIKVVHVHFRRDAHSFSLSEIPFVIGLFLVPPRWFLLALLVGAGAALLLYRRQSPLKLAFNLSQFWLGAEFALLIVHWLGEFGQHLSGLDWLGTFLAALTNGMLSVIAITVAISLSEGRPQLEKFATIAQLSVVVTVTNTSIALLGVTVIWTDPGAAWLMAIPVVTVFMAYRAYIGERQKHERLELLYESSRILQRSAELDSAIVGLLTHARKMFRAEFAEVAIESGNTGAMLRTTVGPDDRVDIMVPMEPGEAALRGCRASTRQASLFVEPSPEPEPRQDGRTVREAMVSPLRGESRQMGTFLVANRMGDVASFDAEDLRLFETLANHAGVALENGQLEQSLTQLSALKEQLRFQAFHDSLTGLGNRALFAEQVEAALQATEPDGTWPSVIFLDVDDFKIVNDSLGHAAGDGLLAEVAVRIRDSIRGDLDTAARLGGDEFAVLIHGERGASHAMLVAQRILHAVRAPFLLDGQDVSVSVSIGIATSTGEQAAVDLLRNADVAMYTAKGRGKGQIAVFEASMHAAIVERHEVGADLARATARGELVVHYQPFVSLRDGSIRGFEALIRWRHPIRGIVGPGGFISIAEETGTIVEIGRWVLSEACLQARRWELEHPSIPPRVMAVNLSARQFQAPDLLTDIRDILAETGLPPDRLVLEITETVMLQDTLAAVARMEALRALGIRIAVDDFGTGYSSLSYLRQFPVDVLKIAREFVDVPQATPGKTAFASVIVAIGRTLGLEVVAEGIETEGQAEWLRETGCELGQGYLWARPGPAAEAGLLLAGHPFRRPRMPRILRIDSLGGTSSA